jgi:hypothetical protein
MNPDPPQFGLSIRYQPGRIPQATLTNQKNFLLLFFLPVANSEQSNLSNNISFYFLISLYPLSEDLSVPAHWTKHQPQNFRKAPSVKENTVPTQNFTSFIDKIYGTDPVKFGLFPPFCPNRDRVPVFLFPIIPPIQSTNPTTYLQFTLSRPGATSPPVPCPTAKDRQPYTWPTPSNHRWQNKSNSIVLPYAKIYIPLKIKGRVRIWQYVHDPGSGIHSLCVLRHFTT